jgi:hypothetical protein
MYFKALNCPSSEKSIGFRISFGKFCGSISFERKLVDRES